MQHIPERALVPLARPQTPGAFYRGLRVVTLDGSTLEVADEAANQKVFGVPGTQQGRTGYPQLRVVGLLENGTHVLFGVALGGYKEAEMSLAHQAVQYLQPGMLCLADRGLSGYPLWQAAMQTGAQLLWHIPKNRILPALQRFEDGSYLSQIEPAPLTRKKMTADTRATPLRVRVIDYRLPGVGNAEPVYRLMTTLLDPAQAPAHELAALYHARWTVETTFAEIKTTLKGADIILREPRPRSWCARSSGGCCWPITWCVSSCWRQRSPASIRPMRLASSTA